MILKIQRPLGGDVDPPTLLVYNEDRSIEMYIPSTATEVEALFNGDMKQYWEAKLGEQPDGVAYLGNQLTLIKQVEAPEW